MGTNYPLNKRRGTGAWQWLIIGFLPGLLIGAGIIAAVLFSGVFGSFGEPQVIEVTREISVGIVVTATPDPNATENLRIITTTPEPTATLGESSITFIDTATPDEVVVATESTDAPIATEEPVVQTQAVVNPTTQNTTSGQSAAPSIPQALADNALEMVTVNGGEFQYGTTSNEVFQAAADCQNRDGGACDPAFGDDSIPQVVVRLDTFSIERTEVTFRQYERFLNYLNSQGQRHTGGCFDNLCIQTANERPDAAVISFDGANYFIPSRLENLLDHPAYGVTWYGAQAYCQSLGRRLPTEAEWEYAARSGGQPFVYPWGNNWNPAFANVRLPLVEGTGVGTVPVTSLSEGRNQLGMYHLAGNVAEWVNDWYDPSYYATLSQQSIASGAAVYDPQGPTVGTQKVLRGGSFNALPFFARTFHRQAIFPRPEVVSGTFELWTGFRCATDGEAVAATINPSSLNVPATGTGDTNDPLAPEALETEESGARG